MDIITVSSGKGGVGKTTTTASLAMGYAQRGKKTVAIDFDIGLRNLDLVTGCERAVIYDLLQVMKGEVPVEQALIQDKREKNLFILAAPQTCNKDELKEADLHKVIAQLEAAGFDKVICDSPAGLDKGAELALSIAEEVIMVVNPEPTSLRDTDRMIGICQGTTGKGGKKISAIITRYNPEAAKRGDMVSVKDIQDILQVKIVGIIPESIEVKRGINTGNPVIMDTLALAGDAYRDAVARLEGEETPWRNLMKKPSLFKRWRIKRQHQRAMPTTGITMAHVG